MKKIITIITIMAIGMWLFSLNSVSASSSSLLNTSRFEKDNVLVGTINKKVNPKEIAGTLGNKILFEYQPFDNLSLNDSSEKEVANIYYYKEGTFHKDTLSTYSTNETEITKEISEFYNDRMEYIKEEKNSVLTSSVNSELFTYVTSGYRRVVSKPYGYMDHSYTVKKYRVNDVTSLYIVETNSEYVPGMIAYANNDTSYDQDMYNYSGYIHLVANQAKEELDQSSIRYGGIPHIKDAWPVNSPGTITISSTYSVGLNLGYSFKNGFSLDNISVESQYDVGLNISYSYSKAYTNQEPRLSAQHDSNNYEKYQWSYQYVAAENGGETFHLRTGYMFEMNNYGHDLLGEGQFGLEYRFRMQVSQRKKNFFGKVKYNVQDPFDGFLYVNWW